MEAIRPMSCAAFQVPGRSAAATSPEIRDAPTTPIGPLGSRCSPPKAAGHPHQLGWETHQRRGGTHRQIPHLRRHRRDRLGLQLEGRSHTKERSKFSLTGVGAVHDHRARRQRERDGKHLGLTVADDGDGGGPARPP